MLKNLLRIPKKIWQAFSELRFKIASALYNFELAAGNENAIWKDEDDGYVTRDDVKR